MTEGIDPTNPGGAGGGEEIPSNPAEGNPGVGDEVMHKIMVNGVEEELPLSKIIDFAQQGRYLAQEKGKYNEQVETKAQELANASAEAWIAEQKAAIEKSKADEAAAKSAEEDLELDDFGRVKKDLKTIQEQLAERNELDKKTKFGEEVASEQKRIDEELVQAKKDFPLLNEINVLAILATDPKADINALSKQSHGLEMKRRAVYEKEFLDSAKKRGARGAEGAGGGVAPLKGTKLVLGQNTREAAEEFISRQKE